MSVALARVERRLHSLKLDIWHVNPGFIFYFCLAARGRQSAAVSNREHVKTLNINNVVWKEGDYFVAQCLNVNISSFGNTKEEALANLNEALELYFEDDEHPDATVIKDAELIESTLKYA